MSEGDLQFSEFDRDGEDIVTRNLAANLYDEQKAAFARIWLERKNQARREASNAEQIRIARSAKNAAWAAATAAILAAVIAMISAVIAFYALRWPR